MESQAGGKAPKVAGQAKHPSLPTLYDPQPKLANKKRKREQKGKDVMEEGRGVPPKENEPQRGAKVAKTTQTRSLSNRAPGDRGHNLHTKVPNQNSPLVLDRSPLLVNSSIRDFQQGKAGYVADAVEQALLLPDDMADLRVIKRHSVFLGLKRDYAMVSISS